MIRRTTRLLWRTAAVAVLLLLAAGLIIPRLDADRFGARIKASLEQALGRKVEIGKVRLGLFQGPGFVADRVVIHDDPAVSLEPFAYVESLDARVSFRSFWTGRLEFSSLRMVNPSVNLMRPVRGGWNFEHLLVRSEAARSAARGQMPEIQIRGGRINFKFGDTKSVFYLSDADLNATPPSGASGEWRVRFEGEPARTDRSTRSSGRFTVTGRWKPGGNVSARLEVDKTWISDLVRLFHGHDIGVQGQVSARIQLKGPANAVAISGRAEVADLHRWDLLPPHGGAWPLDIAGTVDVRSQTLELRSAASDAALTPITLELRSTRYLSDPHWSLSAHLDRFPLAPLAEVARNLGVPLSPEVSLAGQLTGMVSYSPDSGLEGALAGENVAVSIPATPAVALPRAEMEIRGGTAHLAPTPFETAAMKATVEAEYNWRTGALTAAIAAAGAPVPRNEGGRKLMEPVPVLGQSAGGRWSGQVEYTYDGGDKPGIWTGGFQLEDAAFEVPGLAGSIEVQSARVSVRPDGIVVDRILGIAGGLPFRGEYRRPADPAAPGQVRVSFPKADAGDFEALLMPSLRRTESFLVRALRFGKSAVPDWLANRHAEAAVEIGSFAIGDAVLGRVRGKLHWDGPSIDVSDISGQYGEGALSGRLAVNMRRALPGYRASTRFRALPWNGSKWDGHGTLQTSGTGADLLSNLRFEGAFKARAFTLAAETEADAVSGVCAFSVVRGLPVFRFSDLQIVMGESALKGKGATGPDGRVLFDLSDGQKRMRLSGTLSPFQLEMAAAAANAEPLR